MTSECLEESYHVNMIINLLVRFPDIFTITYNLDSSSCCLSYMIKQEIKKDEYITFRRQLEENLEAYHFFKKKEHHKPTVRKKTFRGLTQLEIGLYEDRLLNDEISLVTRFIRDLFGSNLIGEIRPEEADLGEDTPGETNELMEYLLNRSHGGDVKNLFAFRDSGKVYVFDK